MKTICIVLMVMVMISLAVSQVYSTSIVNSKHDIRSFIDNENTDQVCVFCHTPHQTSEANTQYPLWNKKISVNTFGVYSSPTIDAADIAEIGGKAAGLQSVSALCMGCHDGSVAVNSLYRSPNDGDVGDLKFVSEYYSLNNTLSDDHPVNFTYDNFLATKDGSLAIPISNSRVDNLTPYLPLFDSKLQCASCHNVHNPEYTSFLRSSLTGSQLCLRCHIK